jgi:hypothetical protein
MTHRATRYVPYVVLLAVGLLAANCLSAADDSFNGIRRIVAVGDVHGDYDQFLVVLRAAGVIDDKLKWSGGRTHLVQTGDVLDRGPDSRKAIELLRALEGQSRRAGGRVHALIGNHEAMNVYGDLRYVSPAEYEAFRNQNSIELRNAFFQQHVEDAKKTSPDLIADALYRKKWDEQYPLGFVEHRQHYNPKGTYGKWIRGHNVVVKINDSLFLHGGIGPKYAEMSLDDINKRAREELDDLEKIQNGMIPDPDGPLWYRGLAQGDEQALAAHVDAVLKKHEARRIVIGHTPTAGAIAPRFSGKVVLIDVGMSRVYGGPPACLLIEDGKLSALHRGTRLPLPDAGPEMLEYLKKIVSIEPAGSPLKQRLTGQQPPPAP